MAEQAEELAGAVWRAGVREAIYDHVFASPDAEVGGFLLGWVGEDARLRIAESRPAASARRTATSVTFTQEDWADVLAHIETLDRPHRIVGWYHSHPGYGIFLSSFDLFIHQNFFASAGQVAHVVDPIAGREGLFGWSGGEVVKFVENATERPPLGRPAP
ncbi:MAG TPA: Mov34/MPN/PAD-1 family protein [Solirubrobacteraceae bacterium]